MSERVFINDVGPRDGLQNQAKVLSVDERLRLIQALTNAGLDGVEIGAFVSPKAVPAMAGTDEIARHLFSEIQASSHNKNSVIEASKCHYSALIPNMRGFESAQQNGVKLASLVMAASNTMNVKNIRMSNEQTLAVIDDVISASAHTDTAIQVYLATAWECPFEGIIEAEAVLTLADQLASKGVERIVIADTIGAAAPDKAHSLMAELAKRHGGDLFACHFHDTRAMGLANVYAALDAGIRRFDASIAGLGGCPFAPGASGNVATEDVVMMCEQMGYQTGINMQALLKASDLATEFTGTARGGNAKAWLRTKLPAIEEELEA